MSTDVATFSTGTPLTNGMAAGAAVSDFLGAGRFLIAVPSKR